MSQNPNIDPRQVVLLYQSIKDMGAVLQEVGSVNPATLVQNAPRYAQQLNIAAQRFPNPAVQAIIGGTSALLKQMHAFQLRRKLEYMVRPTIPVSIAWDNVPGGSLGAQAVSAAPYTGQPFRVTETLCTAGANFRFPEFNIGGVDFAEPSRTRVSYVGATGVPIPAHRGLDFPQIKARDRVSQIDANWAPWTKVDFTSDATMSMLPFNYGTTAGSVILTLFFRANPCSAKYKTSMLVPMAEQAQRNATLGATYLQSVDPEELF